MPRRTPDRTRADLSEYRRKRDFSQTTEPRGGERAGSDSGRLFVVQKHAARQMHYDMRLELAGVLKSWAVPRGPSLDPAVKALAVQVEDHPVEYGSFEGVIPRGEYGAGTVMLWDIGEWEALADPVRGLEKGDLKFRLHGRKLRGAWVLARMAGSAREWLLIKKRDDESRPIDSFNVLSELPYSAASGRTMEQIATDPGLVWADGRAQPAPAQPAAPRRRDARRRAGAVAAGREAPDASALPGARKRGPPKEFRPQLATPATAAPDGEEWIHEIKLDGYRLLCRIDDGRVRLLTRNGHDWTERMPQIAAAATRLAARSAILDGEVVVLDAAGISDFQALQNAFEKAGGSRGAAGGRLVYFVFDVPFADGCDLTRVPLIERKRHLEGLLAAAPLAAPWLRYCEHIVGRGPIVLHEAGRSGLEGIVSKRADAPYEQRRTTTWLKVKCTLREEFVVGGYTDPAGSRRGLGALLLGQHDERGRLRYRGRVGTGFDEGALADLGERLGRIGRAEPAFVDPQADPGWSRAHWVEPVLVVDVEFNGWTEQGFVRQASYRGLREDKEAREVILERSGGAPGDRVPAAAPGAVVSAGPVGIVAAPPSPHDAFVGGVRISNPLRSVYPEEGITKKEVAEYYDAVCAVMLPHVGGRPLSLVRCPLGLAGEQFYQRQAGEGFPRSIRGIEIGKDTALLVDDRDGLLSLVQMGALEIHCWGCRENRPQQPDRLVFDLDPGPEIVWEHVVESARFLRGLLGDLGLESFVKTTGGEGVHVVVPLARRAGWEETTRFARAVADRMVRIAPRNFVATISKARRQRRIFVDWLRNQRGATWVAPWSTRARSGATVSVPLRWEELSVDLPPGEFTVRTVPARLRGGGPEAWPGFFRLRQSITAAMLRAVEPG